LRFSPDARGSGMGNAGTAISADVNATFWNPSKIVFLENEWNFGLSYSPWNYGQIFNLLIINCL